MKKQILLLIFLIALLIPLLFMCYHKHDGIILTKKAVVIAKSYLPANSSSGIGTGVTTNGTVGTISTYSHSSEKFIVVFTDLAGNEITVNDFKTYASLNTGDTCIITYKHGTKWYNEKFTFLKAKPII